MALHGPPRRLDEDEDIETGSSNFLTPPQGALGARSRTANVRAAFARRRRDAGELRGRAVWLVDDVVTSGATAEACARVLAGAGARAVSVLCLARAAGRVDADGAGGGS